MAVGDDIQEAQDFSVDAAGCRQEGGKERFVDIRGRIIKVLAILLHFGTSMEGGDRILIQTFDRPKIQA